MSNGTPSSWRERAAGQSPRRLVVSERPDPIQLEETGNHDHHDDWVTLGLAALVIGGLLLVALYGPDVLRWLGR
jgi:hypothetical protein